MERISRIIRNAGIIVSFGINLCLLPILQVMEILEAYKWQAPLLVLSAGLTQVNFYRHFLRASNAAS